ncbi:Ldi domain-containing protein [Fusarium falciforme]|uniref:Ldi domain-containing protein n=1 Tax=Fusarium falciforme TaxID=195108 RepID=UPI0022FFFEA8|nr:Ldi domain-containing protein [Fusarium falciforme]WAO86981.1 Ldi domain-containing protein [Fusarium falciforme]
MSREEAGHLRHFYNLASQKDGEWRHMGSQVAGQEWLDGYRYQLATMAYAAGAAHYFRLPLLRSLFKALFEQLISKMLLRDVWGYWYLTSHSGTLVDPDLTELRKPWADPVAKENIMYSGHLLHMVSLYTMLFDDDKYNEYDALEFNWMPIFWGMGPEKFIYNRTSLQQAILKGMEGENWLGVCCEPNSIFVMIGMRYNDVRDNTHIAPVVLETYEEAWKSKGMFQDDGLIIDWFSPKQDRKTLAKDPGFTAWAAAFMNAWNPELAKVAYDTAYDRVIEMMMPPNKSTAAKASTPLISRAQSPGAQQPMTKPILGYAAQMISELGDEATLDQYLRFVDEAYPPTWEQGGLFYPATAQGNGSLPPMDAFTGNSAIPYARLNVFQGQRKMYENPWTDNHFSTYPFIDNIDLSSGVDFLRGSWDKNLAAMAVTMRSYSREGKNVKLHVSGLRPGKYSVYENQELLGAYQIKDRADMIQLERRVTGNNMDIVIQSIGPVSVLPPLQVSRWESVLEWGMCILGTRGRLVKVNPVKAEEPSEVLQEALMQASDNSTKPQET